MLKPVGVRLVSALLLGLLFGCGGGGGSGGDASGGGTSSNGAVGRPPTGSPTSTAVYLAGQAGSSVATNVIVDGVSTSIAQSDLVVFDPQAPSVRTVVVAQKGQYSNEVSIEYGSYDATSKILLEPYIRHLVFAQGGHFFGVILVNNGTMPTPVQISNESGASSLCSFNQKQLVDYTNADNTTIVYSRPGADNVCGTSDDEWRAIRLGMGAADAPISAKQPLTGLINSSGAAVGWLAIEGNALKRYDINFQNATLLTTFSGSAEELSRAIGGFEQVIVRLGAGLYQYNANNGVLNPLFTLSFGASNNGTLQTTTRDSQAVYLAVGNPVDGTTRLYRVPVAGNNFAEIASELNTVVSMETSANRLLYVLEVGANLRQLKSVPKQGGATPVTLPILGLQTFTGLNGVVAASGNKVYYNVKRPNDSPVAGVIDDDGANVTDTDGARWLSIAFSDTLHNVSSISALSRIIRADGVVSVVGSLNYAAVTISSFNPTTGALIANLGVMPAISIDYLSFDKNKNFSIGQAAKSDGSGGYTADLFVVNPDATGITRVTNNIF
ncbi:MAG: hypothetical protein V4568_03855 [Pseudomonadota bacterium]